MRSISAYPKSSGRDLKSSKPPVGYYRERELMTVTEDSTQSLQQQKLQQRPHKLISTTLLRTLQSIAEKRGNKAAE